MENENVSFMEAYVDLMEAERLVGVWERAAHELWAFIRNHVRVVGQDEMDAYYKAKEFYDEAINYD